MIAKRIKALFSRKATGDSVVVPVFRAPFQAWFVDLPGTWLLAAMVIVLSGVYSGTGMFAMMVLSLNLFFRLPFTWLAALIARKSRLASHRSIFILFVACSLGLMYSAHLDKAAPDRAMPLVGALEAFKSESGKYPGSLDELMPKYLAELPSVKPVLSPPQFRYAIRPDGPPHLSFEATGQFAHFSYDFSTKKWVFLD